jgi:tubulin N-terminal N-acetyltransferase
VRPRILLEGATSDHADRDVNPSEEEISTFPMVGDVNLFLKGSPEEGDDEAEAEVMIAGWFGVLFKHCLFGDRG